MFKYKMISACLAVLYSVSAHAEADIEMDDCMGSVEAMYMTVEADLEIPAKERQQVDLLLNEAAAACKAGNQDAAFAELDKADEIYYAAIAPLRGDVTPLEFWQKSDYMWGNRSYQKGVEFTQGQISCDYKWDYVAWRLDLDNPDNPGFNVLAVTKNDAGELKTAHVVLPLDDGQYAVCTAEGAPDPKVYLDEQVDAAFQKELGVEVCPQILRVDDGMCDNIRLMWPKDDAGDEVEFVIHRN